MTLQTIQTIGFKAMKKTFKFIGLLAMAAVLFSCEKKIDPVNPTPKDDTEQGTDIAQYDPSEYLVSFGATIETPGTKATIDPGTGKVAFEENDEVLVVSGDKTATYYFNGTEFIPIQTESPIAISENGMTVYYPYSESDPEFSVSEGTVSFIMPLPVVDTEDLGMKAPMAAQIVQDGASFKAEFKNICSVLQVNVTGELEISSVKLQNAGSSRMPLGEGATFTIGWNDEAEPTMTANESAENAEISILREVTLSATPQTFYYIIPAGVAYTDVSILTQFANEANIGGLSTYTVSRGNWTADRNQIYTMSFYAGLFSGGDGTENNPYKIANSRDFKNLIKYCSEGYGYDPNQMITATTFLAAHYQQTADIDLKSAAIKPIGSTSAPFTGVYDGNSKKLENVQISTTTNDTGLFAYLDGATVKDLTVSGTIQSSKAHVGSIAGRANNASILRCVNQAAVKSTSSSGNTYVGGIVGNANQTDPVTIESCVNEGAVSGAVFLGGIVGDLTGTVDKCVNKANVTGSLANVGGIAGSLRGNSIVRRCYSSKGMEVKGTNRVGGIVGVVNSGDDEANTTWVVNCFSNSNVTGTSNTANYGVGGLVGYITKGILANGATGDVTVKCSASCTDKTKAAVYVGGIVGYLAAGGTIQNVYSPLYAKDIKIGSIHGRSGSGKIGQIVGYTAGTLIGYYFGGCATATTGWQYWGTNSNSTTTAQFAISTANNISFDWTGPVQKNFAVEDWGVSLSAGEYYMSDLMNVAIYQDPLASQYTKASDEVLSWSPIDGTNTTDTHPIPDALISLDEDYYKN